jgi:hypothetical protein
MVLRSVTLLLCCALVSGCATPFQGIRFRAQAPAIDDAFRKLTLALQADGFAIERADLAAREAETAWRGLKPAEMSKTEKGLPAGETECRMIFVLKERGRSFEVYWSPWVRVKMGGSWQESVADIHHPLREKWEKALPQLVEREMREED